MVRYTLRSNLRVVIIYGSLHPQTELPTLILGHRTKAFRWHMPLQLPPITMHYMWHTQPQQEALMSSHRPMELISLHLLLFILPARMLRYLQQALHPSLYMLESFLRFGKPIIPTPTRSKWLLPAMVRLGMKVLAMAVNILPKRIRALPQLTPYREPQLVLPY